ncbi:hypothetical protein SD81_034570 [Tolypothrix campylonemoides VB511288]|nr:hypothetical protein SD81_034570 [Tolypothrix campylonemoides VB511288]
MLNRSSFVKLLLGSLMACTRLMACDANSARSTAQATPVRQSSTAPAKTATIEVKGTPQTVTLSLLQTPHFSTYFPTDRFTIDRSANEDGSVTLYWKKPDGTLDRETIIHFKFYDQKDFNAVKKHVEMSASLISGGYRRVERGSDISYAKAAYSAWLRDLIRLEPVESPIYTKPRGIAIAYLGEVNGQVFVITSYYPRQYGDEFTAREAVVLTNLKFENCKNK